MKISEITGMEGEMVMMQDLFEFKRAGLSSDGKVLGTFGPTGIRSAYTTQLEQAGFKFDAKVFARGGEVSMDLILAAVNFRLRLRGGGDPGLLAEARDRSKRNSSPR